MVSQAGAGLVAPPVTPLNSVGQSSQVSTTGRPDQHFLISHHHHHHTPSSHSHNLNFADNKSSMSARPITDIFLTVAGSGGEGRRERRGEVAHRQPAQRSWSSELTEEGWLGCAGLTGLARRLFSRHPPQSRPNCQLERRRHLLRLRSLCQISYLAH